jgi:hypothetical protein
MNSVISPINYVRAGFALVPIPLGSKGPRTKNWNLEESAVRDEARAEQLNDCNIGLAHRWSGTCAVDVDDFQRADPWFAAHGIDLQALLDTDDAVLIVSGKPNRTKLLFRLPSDVPWLPTQMLGGHGLELRCASGDGAVTVQDVLPPSIHPDTGKPYQWAGKGDWRNLPTLPLQLLALWRLLAEEVKTSRVEDSELIGQVLEGGRNNHLASLAGAMRHRGVSQSVIETTLFAENAERCKPPLADAEVRRIAKSFARYAPAVVKTMDTDDISRVILTRGSDVEPEAVDWLWNGWLAAGKLHLIGGAPGTGKTTIAAALAAVVTRGGAWPDGSQAEAGSVVFWSGEDDNADTLNPRLRAAGANMDRVFTVDGMRDGSERYPFDPARDMDALRAALADHPDVRLIVIDPVVSAINGDSHKNAEVRRGLQPLVDLAGELGCALLGVTHFSKGTSGRDPVERITGSLAFAALARLVIVTAKQEVEGDGPVRRLMLRAKSNIGPDEDGFVYELQQGELPGYSGVSVSSVQWREAVHGSARELLAGAEQPSSSHDGDAASFLRDLLADGEMSSNDVYEQAEAAGYSIGSMKRVANQIGVKKNKQGMRGGWRWRLLPKISFDGLFNTENVPSNDEKTE